MASPTRARDQAAAHPQSVSQSQSQPHLYAHNPIPISLPQLLPPATFARPHPSHQLAAVNGAAARPHSPSPRHPSPSPAVHQPSSDRSPASSPRRPPRPRSPVYNPPGSTTGPPQIPTLPVLLPATVYDPNTPHTGSPRDLTAPSAQALTTPTASATATSSTDYFDSKPRPPPGQRPPSRTKADRILGRLPLGSPPVSVLESEARYRANSGASRALVAGRRPSAGAAREPPPKPAQSAAHERTFSRERDYRDRSESNASSRLDDGVQGTPPRTRERREKDKKTMLSRALQKANTAVLLDNAQNFEGAMEAYGDACKLLQQVMIRSTGEEDKRKLDAIVSPAHRSVCNQLVNADFPACDLYQPHRRAQTIRSRLSLLKRQIIARTTHE